LTNIADIITRNRAINAITEFCSDREDAPSGKRLQLKSPESELPDWTFAIKSNIAVQGLAHTAGIGAYRNRIASVDAFCVARLREAGALLVGTLNMEEAALGATTNNPHFGKTHNPRRFGFTPGGSSGGSGAAVAAGLVRVALGTDTMGSCRIPAAYCGVVGFKPSFGRISMDGVEPLSRRLDHVGILANSVSDVAAMFRVLDVFDERCADARRYPEPQADDDVTLPDSIYLAVLDADTRTGLTPDVRTAYEAALDRLRESGYVLVERAVDQLLLGRARRAGLLVCEASLANSLKDLIVRDYPGVSPSLKQMIAFGASQSAPKLAAAHDVIDDTECVLRELLHDVDAVCWPTAPQSAFSFDAPAPSNQADFTCLANFTGAPAISLPLSVADDALPVGLQLMMGRGADSKLLAIADAVWKQTQH
jgi:aspartyl-tRNA(Asn)/glutamyl-tRNA(Gln) amidotransferase subunit A